MMAEMTGSIGGNFTTEIGLVINDILSNITTSTFDESISFIQSATEEAIHNCNPHNPHFNCSQDEFLTFCRGPQRQALSMVLPVSKLFILLYLNFALLLLISKR